MKRILFVILGLAMLCACNDQVCKISGTMTNPVDTLQLVDHSGAVLDVAPVKDGAFVLKCAINPDHAVSIVWDEFSDPITLIPDSKKIKVAVTDDTVVVTCSLLSQQMQELQQWVMKTFSDYTEKYMSLEEGEEHTDGEEAYQEMTQQIASRCREVYGQHPSDPVGLQAMGLLMSFIEPKEFMELYEQADELIKKDADISGYYEHLKSLPESGVITLLDNGEILKEEGAFEDFVGTGHYTLVDFWASWCGPCRRETPNVVAVFNKYRDKGLTVIGIPVNDEEEAMVKALKDLDIHYPQVIDASQAIADRFHVSGIPYILLFDPEGNIVAEDLREAEIEEAIKKALKK